MQQRLTTRVLRDERGIEVTEWIGLTLVVLALVVLIWQAFYGGPGRILKAGVQRTVERYANGFEGGLRTSGPIGARLRFPPQVEVNADAAPAQVISPPDPDRQVVLPPDPNNQVILVRDILVALPPPAVVSPAVVGAAQTAIVRPAANVQATIDPVTGLVTLVDAPRRLTVTLNPTNGTAALIDPGSGYYQQIELSEIERLRLGSIRYNAPQMAAQVFWRTIVAPVVALPSLVQ